MRSDFNSFNKYEYISDANELPYQQTGVSYDLEGYKFADEDMMYQKNYGIISDGLKKSNKSDWRYSKEYSRLPY